MSNKRFLVIFGFACSLYLALSIAVNSTPLYAKEIKILRFIAVGDTGHSVIGQEKTAKIMARKTEKDPVHFVILLGDNFSGFGVDSIDDPLWVKKFEKMYNYPSLDVPFFAVLGNHDHYGSTSAQVKYTQKSKRWKMPKAYYTFTVSDTQFFMLDTTSLRHQDESGMEQLQWLEEKLESSRALWKIVCGHHTVFSYGYHDDNEKLIKMLRPLFKKYHVDTYICGHGHAMELIKREDHDTVYVVSSTGSVLRKVKEGPDTKFCVSKLGFTYITIGPNKCRVEFFSETDTVDFSHVIKKSGLPQMKNLKKNTVPVAQ